MPVNDLYLAQIICGMSGDDTLSLPQRDVVSAIAKRLRALVNDCCNPPVTFDLPDIDDGLLKEIVRSATPMLPRRTVLKLAREAIGNSPISKVHITHEREVILIAAVYDDSLGRSVLKPVSSNIESPGAYLRAERLFEQGIYEI